MIKPAPPARSIAEIVELETLFNNKVPATTSMLRLALLALVARSFNSRVPAPVFLRMPAFKIPICCFASPNPLSVVFRVSVLATTSIVLGALIVKPWSVAPLAERFARKVPPLRRMLDTPAVAWPRGPEEEALFTDPTSKMPLFR